MTTPRLSQTTHIATTCAGEELRAALEEWQDRRADECSKACTETRSRLTTGFLDGSHPVVDCYELKVLACQKVKK